MSNKITAVLAILIIIGTMGGYYFGNYQGYKTGFNEGHTIGYSEGQEYGYKTGYSNGTKDGYNIGYPAGYGAGDFAGYGRGYYVGESAGRVTGYANGFSVGNTAGYANGFSVGNTTGYDLGDKAGYTTGYQKGWITTGFNIRDPTYQEMLTFISSDKTDDNTYIDSSYVCHDFAIDVDMNAFEAGYRCYWVYITLGNGIIPTAHSCVAFNTTDRGIIFIEPQTDRIMDVRVGYPYWDRTYYHRAPDYDDTVVEIVLMP